MTGGDAKNEKVDTKGGTKLKVDETKAKMDQKGRRAERIQI